INYGHALRGVAGRLFHNDPSRIAILAGASELLGQFPLLFRLKPNATILAVSSDFPSVPRPMTHQFYFENIRVRFVDDLPDRDLTDAIINAIDETTGVIAVSSVQYATGTLVDVSRVARSAQKVGSFLIVDATQAAGAMLVDTSTLEADAVVTSGYKWLDRKSTRLNSSHQIISYAVFCLKTPAPPTSYILSLHDALPIS